MALFRRNDGQDSGDAPVATITPGVPGRCPECDGFGYIDHADLVHHTQAQHCRECGHRWEYHFDDVGVLLEVVDVEEAGAAPAEKTRIIDVRDRVVHADDDTIDLRDPAAADGPQDEIYEKSPGEWLRDTLKT